LLILQLQSGMPGDDQQLTLIKNGQKSQQTCYKWLATVIWFHC